ncbi:hypothetical protein HPP92_000327 [Vanilla planifolia]|uniref:Anticodon-binding domain-containing protein n=1 Tax=Vanilla planifolia TaxID=51239 RepID=A0A835RNZ0_VANPL|nr:hypothetical protein HPP92_000327 [Vanilla planifolia]
MSTHLNPYGSTKFRSAPLVQHPVPTEYTAIGEIHLLRAFTKVPEGNDIEKICEKHLIKLKISEQGGGQRTTWRERKGRRGFWKWRRGCWDQSTEGGMGNTPAREPPSSTKVNLHSLQQEKSGVPLVAHEKYPEPREVEKLVITPSKKELGLAFKGSQKMVVEALEAMSEAEALEMQTALESKGEVEFQVCTLGKSVVIKKNMVSICKEKKKEHHRVFTPSVIEPSFGIGRIIYCLFEHCFYTRPNKSEDEQLNVFRFPPLVAPIKCTVFPLVKSQKFDETAKDISKSLTTAGISHIIDITGTSIGKRYARTDEIGVPFAITVDSTTTVTIRERDSKEQIRVSVDEVASVVKEVTDGQSTWADIMWRFPAHSVSHAEET